MNILFLLSLSLATNPDQQDQEITNTSNKKSDENATESNLNQPPNDSSVNPPTELSDNNFANEQKEEARNGEPNLLGNNPEVIVEGVVILNADQKVFEQAVSLSPQSSKNQQTGEQQAVDVSGEKQSRTDKTPNENIESGASEPGKQTGSSQIPAGEQTGSSQSVTGEQTKDSQSVTANDPPQKEKQGETKQTSPGAIDQAAVNANEEEVSCLESSQRAPATDPPKKEEQGEIEQTSSGAIDQAAVNAKKEEGSGSESSSKSDASNPAPENADKGNPNTTSGQTIQENPTKETEGSNPGVTEKELKDATGETVNPDNSQQETNPSDVHVISDSGESSASKAVHENLTSKSEGNNPSSSLASGEPNPPINSGGPTSSINGGGPNPPKKNLEPSKNDDNKQPSKGDDGHTNMFIWGLLALGFVNSVMLITVYYKIK
ncbi:putative SP-containing membrane protein [Vairimorpha necatrix]|uniref:SP-containing membrane protein n=1 Tax=Vairimorpha necatrix TaxID=6039 RepID=A0AAX4JFZ5_9MICR